MKLAPVVATLAVLLAASQIANARPRYGSPYARGFELGGRIGYALPGGELEEGDFLSDSVDSLVPLELNLGFRFNSAWYLGGYFQYGFGRPDQDYRRACDYAGLGCHMRNLRLGLLATYHFTTRGTVSPWLGLGMGFEWSMFNVDHQSDQILDTTWFGIELANFQFGVDFAVGPAVRVGPFLSLSLGQYDTWTSHEEIGGIHFDYEHDTDAAIHRWFMFGLRIAAVP